MCAVAGLMTSDLISLEHIFVATQSKLRQLSEGPPDPVANKATKVNSSVEHIPLSKNNCKKLLFISSSFCGSLRR